MLHGIDLTESYQLFGSPCIRSPLILPLLAGISRLPWGLGAVLRHLARGGTPYAGEAAANYQCWGTLAQTGWP